MPVDLDALKALYATMLDQIQHAKWTAANRAACKIADDIPALIAELRELRELREAIESTTCDMSPKTASVRKEDPDA